MSSLQRLRSKSNKKTTMVGMYCAGEFFVEVKLWHTSSTVQCTFFSLLLSELRQLNSHHEPSPSSKLQAPLSSPRTRATPHGLQLNDPNQELSMATTKQRWRELHTHFVKQAMVLWMFCGDSRGDKAARRHSTISAIKSLPAVV